MRIAFILDFDLVVDEFLRNIFNSGVSAALSAIGLVPMVDVCQINYMSNQFVVEVVAGRIPVQAIISAEPGAIIVPFLGNFFVGTVIGKKL